MGNGLMSITHVITRQTFACQRTHLCRTGGSGLALGRLGRVGTIITGARSDVRARRMSVADGGFEKRRVGTGCGTDTMGDRPRAMGNGRRATEGRRLQRQSHPFGRVRFWSDRAECVGQWRCTPRPFPSLRSEQREASRHRARTRTHAKCARPDLTPPVPASQAGPPADARCPPPKALPFDPVKARLLAREKTPDLSACRRALWLDSCGICSVSSSYLGASPSSDLTSLSML
jgi:hypothetical protein